MYRLQWSWSVLERCPVLYVQASMELVCNREVSGVICTGFNGVGL